MNPPPLVAGATVRGPLHERQSRLGEDAMALAVLGPGAGAVAAADGAGSASHAALGAATAVEAAAASLRSAWGAGPAELADAVHSAAEAAARALRRRARQRSLRLHALACTLLVALWADGEAAVAHIGDGAGVALHDGGWSVVSAPAHGEYVNETVFLTHRAWRRLLRVSTMSCEGVLVFTDGCERAALRRLPDGAPSAFSGFLQPVGAFLERARDAGAASEGLSALLDAPKLRAVSEDDKTLCGVWGRRGGGRS